MMENKQVTKTNILGGESKICGIRNLEHPDISEAECIDMRGISEEVICPVCREACERVYYKSSDKGTVIGCENCVDYMDSLEYGYEVR